MQKPLAAGQGKTVPGAVPMAAAGQMYPAGCRGAPCGKIPEADVGGRAAPDPGLRRRRGRVHTGFEPGREDTLSSLLPMRSVKYSVGSGEGLRMGRRTAVGVAVCGRPA